MFAANKKVSIRQMTRIIITENIGPACLLGGSLAGIFGSLSYIWVLIVLLFLSMAYMWLALKLSERFGEKLVKSRLFNLCSAARFLVMTSLGIYIFYKTIAGLLLQDTAGIIIIAAVSLLCIFMAGRDYEERGRMHEILYFFVLVPILLILITSLFKADLVYAANQLAGGIGIPTGRQWLPVLALFFMITYFEKLIIVRGHYYNTYGNKIALLKAPVLLWLAVICVYAVSVCIFGENASLLKLMDIGGIPGDFFNRQEAVMAVFLVISLTSYISGMFYYIRQNVKNIFLRYSRKHHIVTGRIVMAVLTLFAILGSIIMAVRADGISALTSGRVIGGREIEQLDIVMSMIMEEIDGETNLIVEIADYETGESGYIKYKGESIGGLEKSYMLSGGNRLDFSHIKGILLSRLSDKKQEKCIKELEENTVFSGNIPVFTTEEDMERLLREEESAGEVRLGNMLERLAQNVEKYKNSCLYKAGISMDNLESISLFNQISH